MELSSLIAKILVKALMFLARCIYKPSQGNKYSDSKLPYSSHIIKLYYSAEKLFNFIELFVGEPTKYNFTIPVQYDSCTILMRPFVFSEIIMVSGLWERDVHEFLYGRIRQDDVVIDVGANIGIYAIPLSRKVKKVIAFEPNSICCRMLRDSAQLNKIDNLVIYENAVDEFRKTILYEMSRVPMNSGVADSLGENVISVKSIDLDSALQYEHRLDWLLIDVEGHELSVIKGACNILQKHSPKLIIEIRNENIDQAKPFLRERGYSLRKLGGMYYYGTKDK